MSIIEINITIYRKKSEKAVTREQLEIKLAQEFNGVKIVKLKDITKKIAINSLVRVTKTREWTNYDEISLNCIDDYGVVYVEDGATNKGPASVAAINSQSLNYGDLILNQRTSKMKVGFIGKEYKRVIIGNNSMIRVQFHRNCIDTARFVQLYLQLPYILEYLNEESNASVSKRVLNKLKRFNFSTKHIEFSFISSQYPFTEFFKKYKRKILSSAQLGDLPIPKFVEKEQGISLSEVLYPRMELIAQARKMKDDAQRLIDKYEAHKMELADMEFLQKIDYSDVDEDVKEIEVFEKAGEIYSKLLK